MKVLIAGNGAVGSALGDLIASKGHTVVVHDPPQEIYANTSEFDFIHITFPMVFEETFVAAVQTLLDHFTAKYFVIIHSTITPLAFDLLDMKYPNIRFVFSPIRARERDMNKEVKDLPLLFAIDWPVELFNFPILDQYLYSLNHNIIEFTDIRALILGKLAEVTWFGMNIAFAQQMKSICDDYGMKFNEAYTQYTQLSRIGKDYTKGSLEYIPRPVFKPDVIGGKCVIQDTILMRNAKLGNPKLYEWILESNEETKRSEREHD